MPIPLHSESERSRNTCPSLRKNWRKTQHQLSEGLDPFKRARRTSLGTEEAGREIQSARRPSPPPQSTTFPTRSKSTYSLSFSRPWSHRRSARSNESKRISAPWEGLRVGIRKHRLSICPSNAGEEMGRRRRTEAGSARLSHCLRAPRLAAPKRPGCPDSRSCR